MAIENPPFDSAGVESKYVRYLGCYLRRRKDFFLSSSLLLIVGIWISFFFLKPTFLSSITFLPPVASSGMPSFLGADISGLLGGQHSSLSSDQVKTIAEGEDFQRYLISRFNLAKRYKVPNGAGQMTKTRKIVEKLVQITSVENSGIGFSSTFAFILSAEDESPDTAAILCSAAYSYLDSMVRSLSSQRARQSALFLAGYIANKQHRLDSLQAEMMTFRRKNKILDVSAQQQLSVGYLGGLREQILKAELEYSAIASSKGEASTEAKLVRQSVLALKAQMNKAEEGMNPDLILNVGRSAAVAPYYINLVREIEIENKAIIVLRQQLESERLEEVRTTSPLQIIDLAHVPDYKTRPKRILVLAGILLGGIFLHLAGFGYYLLIQDVLAQSQIIARVASSSRKGR